MSPMCSRTASDSVRQGCGGYHCELTAGPWCVARFCPDPFVMCLIYVPKIIQNVIRILLPHFHSEILIFWLKNIQNCHRNSFEWKCLQASILRCLQSQSWFYVKRSVLIKMDLCFGKRFRAVKNICKNSSICIKDTAPTFLLVESRNQPDTAHTNSSRG